MGTGQRLGREGPAVARGLELGNRSVDILASVQSTRTKDYVREFNATFAPWRRGPAGGKFVHRARTEFGVAA
ncbi:hypothetical protein [Streptomyces sp. NPDC048637]|uniref:hypothetical protein n=1 Tax=Streptomyces sp. NPDC048637 TaxID=3155636 RepID=UPI003437587C